jgi:hypothetical protein
MRACLSAASAVSRADSAAASALRSVDRAARRFHSKGHQTGHDGELVAPARGQHHRLHPKPVVHPQMGAPIADPAAPDTTRGR